MMKYKIIRTEQFRKDLTYLLFVITDQYKAPLTAKRYVKGLYEKLKNLENSAGSLPYCRNKSIVERYGKNFKRFNFKKVSVIFYVEGYNVYLVSIFPAAGFF